MLAVSVTLDQVTRSGSGARSNHSAFLASNQRSADRACHSANNRALGLAVVVSVRSPVGQAFGGRQNDKS